MATKKYICNKCGNSNVKIRAWVDANTLEFSSEIDDNAECWCEDCMELTILEVI